MYTLLIGLEHLQTGIEFAPIDDGPFLGIVLQAEGPTTFVAWSIHPFKSIWQVAGAPKLTLLASRAPGFTPSTPETHGMIRERVQRNNMLARGGN